MRQHARQILPGLQLHGIQRRKILQADQPPRSLAWYPEFTHRRQRLAPVEQGDHFTPAHRQRLKVLRERGPDAGRVRQLLDLLTGQPAGGAICEVRRAIRLDRN